MNDLTIIILLFSGFIILALIIKYFLDKENDKEDTKPIIKETNKDIKPSLSLLAEEETLKNMLTEISTDKLEIPIGTTNQERIITIDLEKSNNILILGTTGGGKSICLDEIITSLIMTKTKEEVRISTIDTSLVELSHFNYLPHYIKDTIVSPEEIIEELQELKKELNNRKRNSTKIPLIVIIDDLYDICTYQKEILNEIEYLLREGGKEKMYFILTTDTPSKDILTDRIKENIQTTIYLTLSPGSEKDFDLGLTKSDYNYTTTIGNAIYKHDSKKEKIFIPEIKESTLEKIRNSFKD